MFRRFCYKPTKKLLDAAIKGWKESLEELAKVYSIVLDSTEKQKDGSIISPFQIKK